MAFELPALPNFNVQVPDITAKALEGAQLRNMLSEMSLRKALAPGQLQLQQQQVQAATTQNELQQMQLQGQRALADWLKNGDANEDVPAGNFSSNDKIATFVGVTPNDPIMSVIRSMAKHNVPAPMLVTEAQGMLQRRTEYFKGTKEEQDAQKAERTIWQDTLASLHEMPADQRSAQLAAKLPLLQENSKTDPLLAKYAGALAGHPELIDPAYNMLSAENQALNLRKGRAEAATAEQKVIPTGGTISPEQQAEANKQVAVETNPAVQAGKLALATAEARAREQVQASMLPIMEQIRQQFANQKDARDKISSTVLKPYEDKMSDVTMARDAIALAGTNPVAARMAVFKVIGVAQPTGSHRVIPAEIEAFRYPGGLGTRVAERVADFLNGKPWTQEIQNAVGEVITGQETAARNNLNRGIDDVNKNYDTNVATGLKQTPQNQTGQLPKSLSIGQLQAYAQAHGVSYDEAKRQAKAQGINVP